MLKSSSSSSRCRARDVIEQHSSFMENKRRRLNEDEIKLLEQDLEELLMEEEQDGVRSMINGLPSDLWLEILRRIPAAHLFPLKTVCKTFHRLISDDFFVRLPHLKDLFTNKPTTSSSACFIISTDPKAPTLTYDPEKGAFRVCPDESRFDYWCSSYKDIRHCGRSRSRHLFIDSYHGLLLVRVLDRLLLCNPITRSYIQFLPSICGFSHRDFGCWKIAYDDVSEKYKVFGLRLRRNKVSLYVFDVEDGRCHLPREITTTAEVGSDQIIVYDVIKESVLVNGNVCWLIITKESEKETEWHTSIVSASVTTEEVKTRSCSSLPVPIDLDYHTLFAANGTFYIGKSSDPTTFALWILECENSNLTWRSKHWIGAPIVRILSSQYVHIRALGLFRDKVLIMIMQSYRCYQLCMYDVISGDFDKVTLPREEEYDKVTWGNFYFKREGRSFGPFRILDAAY